MPALPSAKQYSCGAASDDAAFHTLKFIWQMMPDHDAEVTLGGYGVVGNCGNSLN
jgi:hypothetical protein